MKQFSLTLLFCASIFVIGCKNDNKEKDSDMDSDTEMTTDTYDSDMKDQDSKKVKVNLQATSDSQLTGNVVFTQENGEVSMTAIIDGLSEGMHAIHIHENADCSAKDGSSAGGHWNPTFEQHGKWGSPDGYHKGDIGNFQVNADGNGTITMTTDEWCIGCGDANKDILGKAVVIHDGVDDFTSQPSGDAGKRVGCGPIKM